ncbi:MAG: DUF1937 family protein [Xanthobacteraceae bacterium]
MNLSDLTGYDLIYVGSPYTKYPTGIEAAFATVCSLMGKLLAQGLNAYSPIAHTHPIAFHGRIDPLDHQFWLAYDAAMMAKSDAMIVAMMDGWEMSYGVRHEIETFQVANKPVFFLNPKSLSVRLGYSSAA